MFQNKYPFLVLSASIVIGILLSDVLEWWYFCAIGSLGAGLFLKRSWVFVVCLCTGLGGLMGGIAYSGSELDKLDAGTYTLEGELTVPIRKTKYGYFSWLEIKHQKEKDEWVATSGTTVIYFGLACPADYLVGEHIYAGGKLSTLSDTSSYDKYLKRKGVTHKFNVGCSFATGDHSWRYTPAAIQAMLAGQIDQHLPPSKEAAVAKALLMGDKTDIPRELKEAYANTGVAHILALSGMHMNMLALLLYLIINRLGPPDKYSWLRMLSVLFVLWVYAFITGLSPSVIRAVLLASVIIGARLVRRRANLLNLTGFCMFLQLIWDPRLVYSISFQLSYAAIFGILLFVPLIYEWWRPKPVLLKAIWALVLVSIGAQLFTMPFVLFHFGQFPLLFLPVNLVLSPIVFAAMQVGLYFLILHWLPGINELLAWALYKCVWIMNELTTYVATLPYATVYLKISEAVAWTIVAGLVGLFAYLWSKKKKQFLLN